MSNQMEALQYARHFQPFASQHQRGTQWRDCDLPGTNTCFISIMLLFFWPLNLILFEALEKLCMSIWETKKGWNNEKWIFMITRGLPHSTPAPLFHICSFWSLQIFRSLWAVWCTCVTASRILRTAACWRRISGLRSATSSPGMPALYWASLWNLHSVLG